MKVSKIMTQPLITATPDDTLEVVAGLMLTHEIGCVPIVDARGKLCGIVTESDFSAKERGVPFSTLKLPAVFHQWMPQDQVERLYEAARSTPARDIMTADVATLDENDDIETALRMMLTRNLRRLPVISEGRAAGIVTRRDLLRLMARKLQAD